MRDPAVIQRLCRAVLDAVCAYYDDAGVELPGRPAEHELGAVEGRRQVTGGPPSWPCPSVSVWVERTAGHEGDISRETVMPLVAAPASTLRAATLVVTITRCSPDIIDDDGSYGGRPKLPTLEAVEEIAALIHSDEVYVIEAIRAAAEAELLPDDNDWALLDWSIIGPAGGFVGSDLRLKVSTDWLPLEDEDD